MSHQQRLSFEVDGVKRVPRDRQRKRRRETASVPLSLAHLGQEETSFMYLVLP